VLQFRAGEAAAAKLLLKEASCAADRQGANAWLLRIAIDRARFAPSSEVHASLDVLGAILGQIGPGNWEDRRRAVAVLRERQHTAKQTISTV
jgi:hypothetical protein